jgi:hypothetical protein
MLQTDITILQQRQKVLEKEIEAALSHGLVGDPMIADLKSRIIYVKEEIDRLRHEKFVSYHWSADVLPLIESDKRRNVLDTTGTLWHSKHCDTRTIQPFGWLPMFTVRFESHADR